MSTPVLSFDEVKAIVVDVVLDANNYNGSDRDPLDLGQFIDDTLRELLSDIRMRLEFVDRPKNRLEDNAHFDRQAFPTYLLR